MEFTGERFIPGKAFGEIEAEHIQRYHSIIELVKDKIVLDAACGEGYGSSIISSYARKVYGMDISEEAIENAKKKYNRDNVEFNVGDICKIPLENNSIDIVISFETIEHINAEMQNRFLKEIKRVLKTDGILIMSTPDKKNYSDINNFENTYHIKEFYYDEFRNFLQSSFKDIYMFDQGFEKLSIISNSIKSLRTKNKYSILEFNNNLNENRKYIIAVCSDNEIPECIDKMQTCVLLREPSQYQNTLYIDLGEGYCEEISIKQECNILSKSFMVNFDLSNYKNIKSVRWDPIEGKICNIKILSIEYADELGVMQSLNINEIFSNGKIQDGIIKFETFDPMIFIPVNNIKFLNINGEWEFINYIDYEKKYLNRYKDDINEKSKLVIEQALQIQNNEKVIKEMELQIQNNESIITELELEIINKSNLSTNKDLEIRLLQEKINLILNSNSWKITRPFRRIMKFLKKA